MTEYKYYTNNSIKATTGLVAAWNMIPSKGELVDISGNGNNGTIHGALSTKDGLKFDGSSDYVNIGNDTSLSFGTEEFTFALWFKIPVSQSSTFPVFISKGTWNTPGGYIFYVVDNKFKVYLDDTGPVRGLTNVNDNQWHCGVITREGNNIVIYFDGQIDNSGTISNVDIDSIIDVGIGARQLNSTPNNFLNGSISDVKIWNRVLSSQEVKNLYNEKIKPTLLEDFSNNGADGVVKTPRGWVKGTGSFYVEEVDYEI